MEINKAHFYNIVYSTTFDEHERFNIGTYREKKLHIILKRYFEPDKSFYEIPVGGYIADIKKDNCITEIETSGFSGLKPKLQAYLDTYQVTLVYPLAAKRYISWIDPETFEISQRRQSPKKQNAYDTLFEMVRILPYINHPNLTVVSPVLEVDEYRLLNGWSRDRKKGSERYERVPVDLYDMIAFHTNEDFCRWIPLDCREDFTAGEFAAQAKIPRRDTYAVLRVLEARRLIYKKDKRGREELFSRTDF